ncbi:putative sugar ABC transporter, periplasmic solute-binding protein [Oceanospirillum sp. MED92]|uniref:Putative sugar ABC transporter, periplasmic solute-binding protein n=2 Tax=Neptuniibacter caesariensis TaxID=207954 RepID=A0A7U8C7D2_NEPCE|nr:putative sugar ABC transporter, periplasmic solute-binding protein [Oceanospirillum sp. MED92] [Neptuniibacter caesariensis]
MILVAVATAILIIPSPTPHGGEARVFIEQKPAPSLNILWAEWKPADYLQKLTREFSKETGIEVNITQRSWSDWQQHFANEMGHKSQRYDMVIGDSQWLGYGAEQGHYVNLTHWMKRHSVEEQFISTALKGYSEYPKGSKRYWAIPVEGDAMGFAYRKDLFNDPAEKAAFSARYGYELDVPKTWFQLRDIAEFFYRPAEDLWGLMAWQEPYYDGLTMAMQTLLWGWGAGLGDQESYQVKGILNSVEAAEALLFYKQLVQLSNPDWRNYYLDTEASSNKPMIEGKVAMTMVYFAITPELLDPAKNPYANEMGFFSTPAGPAARATSLGGQGISLISYSKKKEYSLQFLEWFISKKTQEKWSELGGLSCHIEVLKSARFLDASPMHQAFSESFEFVEDFWAVPEYAELLKQSQQHWSFYLNHDSISAKDTLDNLAQEWEQTFEQSGYYRE